MISIRKVLWALPAAFFAAACAFFVYYTLRLAYVNLADAGVASHRQAGMYIGAVAFPLASLVFGYLSFRCGKVARSR